ncbi:MAG: hypothetical protein ACLUD9_07605 [Anaerotignum faecicola]
MGRRQGNGADEGKTEKRKLKKAKPPSGGDKNDIKKQGGANRDRWIPP